MSRFVVEPQGFPWKCADPFLFCVHHLDAYPKGNGAFGPAASLAGRQLGQDFAGRDGWNMYHGRSIPGFPPHPHRGFETVTAMRSGFVDHSDSLGAAARFGAGDVQWMTAGRGVVHSEMFPLLDDAGSNPLELFQIWVNLPPDDKMVDPHFAMLWGESIPKVRATDAAGRATEVTVIAGPLGDAVPPPPPPKSWAANPDHQLALWAMVLEPGAEYTLPEVATGVHRTLQVFRGRGVAIEGTPVFAKSTVFDRRPEPIRLVNGPEITEILLMQARPIGRPVVQHGPFVMNTRAEIVTAFEDYQRTRFGGWPWPGDEPVHGRERERFAKYPDGTVQRPPGRSAAERG